MSSKKKDPLRECFTTTESGEGEYRMVMKFPTLADMQAGRRQLIDLLAQPAQQHQGDPVAYADPKSFENFKAMAHLGGLYLHEWMWAEFKPWLRASRSSLDACALQIENLQALLASCNDARQTLFAQLQASNDKLAELQQAFTESQQEVVKRGKMLAEAHALLREASNHANGYDLSA